MSRQEILDQIKEAYGFVPGFFASASDVALAEWWAGMGWHQSDTALSARDKALVSFGAAAAIHCEYWVPFHTAQLALYGTGEDGIKEASWAAKLTAGLSTYFYGIGYDHEQFKQEVAQIVQHITESAQG